DEEAIPADSARGCRPALRLGKRGARAGTARRCVRTRARAPRLSSPYRLGRGLLAALLVELRAHEDAGRVTRRRPARGVPPGVGRLLRVELPEERRDRPRPRVAARARDSPLSAAVSLREEVVELLQELIRL